MNRKLFSVFAVAVLCSACDAPAPPNPDVAAQSAVAAPASAVSVADPVVAHADSIRAWRETRVGNLRKPDGWLSLVGLHWLGDGEQTLGRAADRAIVLATGPEQLGVLTPKDGKVALRLDPGVQNARVQTYQGDTWIDAVAGDDGYLLQADSSDSPGRILVGDDINIALIQRGDKLALRVKDANAKTRSEFTGIDYFDIDPSWRIDATWTMHEKPQTFEIQTVLGTVEEMSNPGFATFTRDGKEYRLYPVNEEGSTDLFFIFADRTSGRETYGPGRFFYASPSADGRQIVLDFNKAYNPPCAFTEYSTCPLPPPENRLDLAVTAGEKKYAAAH